MRHRASRLRAWALGALIGCTALPAHAGLLEDCTQTDDWWLRIEACTKAIDSGQWPGSRASWAYSNRAVAHASLGDYISAFDDHEKAIRLDSANASARNNKANSHADFREYDRALKDYAAAIDLKPGYLNAHYNRAGVLMAVGRPADAEADYTVVIAGASDFGEAYLGRSDAACAQGKTQASVQDRLAAIGLEALGRGTMAAYLRSKGYLAAGDDPDEAGFVDALTEWTAAGCP